MTDPTRISLSGYLPGNDYSGLNQLGDSLRELFDNAYESGDETGETTRVLVIGLLNVESVKRRRHPDEKPPVVELRFERIETVPAGADYATARGILDRRRDDRVGDTAFEELTPERQAAMDAEEEERLAALEAVAAQQEREQMAAEFDGPADVPPPVQDGSAPSGPATGGTEAQDGSAPGGPAGGGTPDQVATRRAAKKAAKKTARKAPTAAFSGRKP